MPQGPPLGAEPAAEASPAGAGQRGHEDNVAGAAALQGASQLDAGARPLDELPPEHLLLGKLIGRRSRGDAATGGARARASTWAARADRALARAC